jgi:hypothetical protein
MKDFYFIYFPIGYDFIQTMIMTFRCVPKETNIIVVTNHPEVLKDIKVDFNLIVLNVDDLRDEWSKENEILIYEIEAQAYRDKLFEFQDKEIKFPYGIHRCILPWLVERNITKFAILDADCLINFDNELETTMNALKEYCKDDQFVFGPIMNQTSYKENFLRLLPNTLSKYNIPLSIIESMPPLYKTVDGYLRGFWFNNTEDILLFYKLWDEILKEAYKQNDHLLKMNKYTISDEWLHGLVSYVLNQFRNIKVEDLFFNSHRIIRHIYHPENYYYNFSHNLYSSSIEEGGYGLKPSNFRSEFIKENKDRLIRFFENQNGIPKEKINKVIYDWDEQFT